VTLLVYATTDALSLVTHRHPLANPVLHSIWIIGAFLLLTVSLLPQGVVPMLAAWRARR